MSLLSVTGLSKSFGGLRALDDVSIEVEAGSVHGLMGANGAGKTTLFSIIAGNQAPTAGHVSFAGRRIEGLRPDQICRLGIARTFQIVRPFPAMTARENVETAVMFGRGGAPSVAEVSRIAEELLSDCGLAAFADRPASTLTLSGRKRLEVARALGTGPQLLMLDEVMAGLTPTEVMQMLATLRDLKARHGLTILIIEHVMSALDEISDRITVLHHGRLIAEGPPAEIIEDPRVNEAYFGADDDDAGAA